MYRDSLGQKQSEQDEQKQKPTMDTKRVFWSMADYQKNQKAGKQDQTAKSRVDTCHADQNHGNQLDTGIHFFHVDPAMVHYVIFHEECLGVFRYTIP